MSEIGDQAPVAEAATDSTPSSAPADAATEKIARETAPQVGSNFENAQSADVLSATGSGATGTVVTAGPADNRPLSDNRPTPLPRDTAGSGVADPTAESSREASVKREAQKVPPAPVPLAEEKTAARPAQIADAATPEQAAQSRAAAPPKTNCLRVGPFKPDEADKLLARLPPQLELISDTTEEVAEADGYYVLIPPLASRAAGIRKVEQLRESGITDIYLFRGGELRNAISLGLYSNKSGAQRHADRLEDKGVDSVEVRERKTSRERRWLLFRNTERGDPEGVFPLPAGVRVASQPCP